MQQKNLFAEVLSSVTKYLRILVIIVIAGIFLSGIRVVDSGNVALILRFGKLVGDTPEEQVHEAGLLLAFPYIIDEVIMVPVSNVMEQTVTTHYTESGYTRDGGYVLTGDQNVALLTASVKYNVSDPVAYALNVKDIPAVINGCVSTAMLTEAANMNVNDLLTAGKDGFTQRVIQKAGQKLDAAGVGITLATVELTTVSMPGEVKEICDGVNAATVYAATMLENARNYYESIIPYTESVANQLVALENTNHTEAVAEANLAMSEFWGLLDEFKTNPQVVKTRVFNEKVAKLLETVGQIRVVQDGESKIFLNP